MAKRMMNEILAAVVAGETISDDEIKGAAYAIEYYEITVGDMSQSWHTCTEAQLGDYIGASQKLRARLKEIEAQKPAVDQVAVDLQMEIADLEERAQNAEDCEKLSRASDLRKKARALKDQLKARMSV